MRKIVITGPESSGKTTLAKQLSKELGYALVHEFARDYLDQLTSDYQLEDVLHMAQEQLKLEKTFKDQSTIHDTDLTVFSIWLKEKYNRNIDWIEEHLASNTTKIYLLCDVLDNWEKDPLREHPNADDRKRLFKDYLALLKKYNKPYHVISGNPQERLKKAKNILINLI